jgi:hypothetical protein
MKTPSQIRKLSVSLSLVILALGFAALGLVPFLNTQSGCSSGIFSVERVYSLIGSTLSVLVGATFLVAVTTLRGVKAGSEKLLARIDANLFDCTGATNQ